MGSCAEVIVWNRAAGGLVAWRDASFSPAPPPGSAEAQRGATTTLWRLRTAPQDCLGSLQPSLYLEPGCRLEPPEPEPLLRILQHRPWWSQQADRSHTRTSLFCPNRTGLPTRQPTATSCCRLTEEACRGAAAEGPRPPARPRSDGLASTYCSNKANHSEEPRPEPFMIFLQLPPLFRFLRGSGRVLQSIYTAVGEASGGGEVGGGKGGEGGPACFLANVKSADQAAASSHQHVIKGQRRHHR